jgi:chromosomal replication initiator protein
VRLVAISSLRGVPISKMLAQDAIRNIAESDQPAGITIEQIQQAVSTHYRLRVDEIKSKIMPDKSASRAKWQCISVSV